MIQKRIQSGHVRYPDVFNTVSKIPFSLFFFLCVCVFKGATICLTLLLRRSLMWFIILLAWIKCYHVRAIKIKLMSSTVLSCSSVQDH